MSYETKNIDADKLIEGLTDLNTHHFETSEEKKRLCRDMISVAKVRLLSKNTTRFYSILAMNMNVKMCNIGTIATDGKTLYVDPQFICGADPEYLEHKNAINKVYHELGMISDEEFVEITENLKRWYHKKSLDEVVALIVHEVRHTLGATTIRKMSKPTKELINLYSFASDFLINGRIAYELCGNGGSKSIEEIIKQFKKDYPIFEQACIDEKYYKIENNRFVEWTVDEVYEDLLKKRKQKQEGDGGGSDEGEGKSFDVHLDITEEQAEKIKGLVIQAASGMQAGDIPSDIKIAVDNWTKPQIKWTTFLDRSLKSQIIHDYDYSKPAARSFMLTKNLRKKGYLTNKQHMIVPSMVTQDTLEVMLVFDSSGSIYGSQWTLSKILGEAAGIIKQFPNGKVHVCCFDTKVHNYQVFDSASLEDLKSYSIQGGGGSSITCVGEMIRDNKIVLNSMVVFTDLEIDCDWSLFNHIKNSVWVVFNRPDLNAPMGKTIHYKEDW